MNSYAKHYDELYIRDVKFSNLKVCLQTSSDAESASIRVGVVKSHPQTICPHLQPGLVVTALQDCSMDQ